MKFSKKETATKKISTKLKRPNKKKNQQKENEVQT